jgi:hypothetical protein
MSNSVSRKELALCKRRGHEPHLSDKRQQCPWCGIWLRTVTTIEEREDEPPEEEQEQTFHLLRKLKKVKEEQKGKCFRFARFRGARKSGGERRPVRRGIE